MTLRRCGQNNKFPMFYYFIKRLSDIVLALVFLILFIPLWIIIPIMIKLDSPGRVIFTQKRVGAGSSYFTIYKFRTMKEGTPDIPTDKVSEQDKDKYKTGVGTFLRKLSLDEIPQLVNILKGDMSFVGPRPALYNQPLLIRLRKEKGADKVRPGVTGLAQISGRDSLSIPKKVEYDSVYSRQASIILDIKIFLVTIKAVLTGKGAK
ncbi:MAG: sugar transferase [Actinomycetota bacterium]